MRGRHDIVVADRCLSARSLGDRGERARATGIDVGAHLPGARSLDISRAYVLAFFDQHLRGEPRSLLDGASARYPEVGFRFPEE